MRNAKSQIEQELFDLTMQHLAKLDDYVPGPVKKAARAKNALIRVYQEDPVFSIFGLDSPEYIAATLSGGTITSIHRKLGDIYEDSVSIIFARTLNVGVEDLRYSATIVVDNEQEERSIDAYLEFSRLAAPIRERVKKYCETELHKLSSDPQVKLKGAGLEVRHCYQTGDSKRSRADLAMARHLILSGILPLIPFFCNQSNISVISRYTGVWVVKQGLESYELVRQLSGFDYFHFLKTHRDEFRQPVIKILRSLAK